MGERVVEKHHPSTRQQTHQCNWRKTNRMDKEMLWYWGGMLVFSIIFVLCAEISSARADRYYKTSVPCTLKIVEKYTKSARFTNYWIRCQVIPESLPNPLLCEKLSHDTVTEEISYDEYRNIIIGSTAKGDIQIVRQKKDDKFIKAYPVIH